MCHQKRGSEGEGYKVGLANNILKFCRGKADVRVENILYNNKNTINNYNKNNNNIDY